MRAVFFCSTSASILTRSTSTLTTSSDDSGVGVGVGLGGSWIAFRLGRPMFAFKFLFGVCEVTGLVEQKSRAATMIEVTRKRGSRKGRRYLISSVNQMQVSVTVEELTGRRDFIQPIAASLMLPNTLPPLRFNDLLACAHFITFEASTDWQCALRTAA